MPFSCWLWMHVNTQSMEALKSVCLLAVQVRSCRWSELPTELNTSSSLSSRWCCSSRSCPRCSLEVYRPPSYSRSVLHTSAFQCQQWLICSSPATGSCRVCCDACDLFHRVSRGLLIASQCKRHVSSLDCLDDKYQKWWRTAHRKRSDGSRAGLAVAVSGLWTML